MKKILIITGTIVLIIGILAALPFLYKDKLLAKVKTTINKQVNAKVDFAKFNLSVFSEFPKVKMEIQGLTVVGINEFSNDTILSASSISTNISLMEMIRGEDLELKVLNIDNPKISLVVNPSGAVNWNITKTPETPAATSGEATGAEEAFKMKLNDIQVKNLNLQYNDKTMPMKLWLKNSNLSSTGEVDGTLTTFDLKGEVDEFIFEYDSVQYISKTKLKAETLLKV
ncbi:MAG: hypothetical protein Q8K69_03000, partial [Bacteroidota bacterium]|nr:hypothetical protein [Bacteroidota bacterium]